MMIIWKNNNLIRHVIMGNIKEYELDVGISDKIYIYIFLNVIRDLTTIWMIKRARFKICINMFLSF